jgi:hypothetical protein
MYGPAVALRQGGVIERNSGTARSERLLAS